MNDKQRKTLITTAAIVAAMVLYPPYHLVTPDKLVLTSGYGYLFALPLHREGSTLLPTVVDVATLLVQMLGAVTVCGLLVLAFRQEGK